MTCRFEWQLSTFAFSRNVSSILHSVWLRGESQTMHHRCAFVNRPRPDSFSSDMLVPGADFSNGDGIFWPRGGLYVKWFYGSFLEYWLQKWAQKRRLGDNSSSLWWFEQYHVNVFQRLPCTLQSEASLDFAHRYLRQQHKCHDTRVHICHPAHFDKTSVV